MFYDLNVPWTSADGGEVSELRRTVAFLDELGYDVVALCHTLSGKLPADLTCPIPDPLPFPLPSGMRVLRRLTLVHSDTLQNHRLKDLNAAYDILAIRPTTEESLKQACKELDCDIISLDLTQRFGFHFTQFKLLSNAIARGIKFEICYSAGIVGADANARRNLISNTIQLLRATRGRGVIISSESKRAIGCRSPWDVINLATIWGMSQERGKEAVTTEARSVVVNAALKRTSYRGAIDVIYGGEKPVAKARPGPDDRQKKDKNKEKNQGKNQTVQSASAENAKKRKLEADIKELKAQAQAQGSTETSEPKISNREKKRREKKARYEAEKAEKGKTSKTNSGEDQGTAQGATGGDRMDIES